MDRVRLPFADSDRPNRSGALVLDDAGAVQIRVSDDLAKALERAVDNSSADLAPLRFDYRSRGLVLTAALAKGVRANLLECDLVAGGLELRAYLDGWVRLILRPGDFDPDEAWEFLLAFNDAKLEAPRA